MNLVESVRKGDYVIIKLNRGKANPINNDLVKAIREAIADLGNDDTIRGGILTGNTDGFFSVGLDLKALHGYNESQIKEFHHNWDNMITELVQMPKPLIAAVNGYSIAAGCFIALTCDYRIMAKSERFTIGLNEIAAGVSLQEYVIWMYSFWSGKRLAYQNLLEGKLLKVEEAYQEGMIDERYPIEDLLPEAEKKMQKLLRTPDNLLQDAKLSMRADLIAKFTEFAKKSKVAKIKAWFEPDSIQQRNKLIERLSK